MIYYNEVDGLNGRPGLVRAFGAPLSFFILGVVLSACTDNPSNTNTIQMPLLSLQVEYAGVVEAWISVSVDSTLAQKQFSLRRDTQIVFTGGVLSSDTTIIDEGLLPDHAYTYRAFLCSNSNIIDSTEGVSVTTMDTTSHNLSFRVDTLGAGTVRDAAIISDLLIYVCGEMYPVDSLGNQTDDLYNLAKWNGVEWDLAKVTVDFRGNQVTVPLEGIVAHSPSDIWVVGGGIPIHGDGENWQGYDIQNLVGDGATVSHIWGESSSNMYFVGRSGNILHFNGVGFSLIESGTTLDIWDIWGSTNSVTGVSKILCVASDLFGGGGRELLQVNGTSSMAIEESGLASTLSGIWFEEGRHYYIVGSGIHEKRDLGESAWTSYPPGVVTSYYSEGVRGTGINDVFVVGSLWEMVHFNGATWKSYREDLPFEPGGVLGRISLTHTMMVAVGYRGNAAVVVRGIR